MQIRIFGQTIFVITLISVVLSQPPSYSARYSKILYQPQQETSGLQKAELNSDRIHKEEVTEKSSWIPTTIINQTDSEIFAEMTTEPESEQINFARYLYSRITKDKIKVQTTDLETTTALSIEDKLDPFPTEESASKSAYRDVENLEDSIDVNDASGEFEINDLNNQGVYYIIHPNGLFQKVVYKVRDQPEDMEFSSHMYENIAPIVEPVYTYDPETFVFQRLILRQQSHILDII